MWNKQAAAVFLVYLTLSGHALRRDIASVEQSLAFEASQQGESQGESSMDPRAFLTAEEQFHTKLTALQQHPSMKLSGSGGKFMSFWIGLRAPVKKCLTDVFQDDIDEMEEDKRTGTSVDNAAILLQEGINQWFENQREKHPWRTEYYHCKFNVAALRGHVQADLTLDQLADLMPIVLESDQPGQSCGLATSYKEKLSSKPQWAKWLLGIGSNSTGAKAFEDAMQDDSEGSLLEEKLASLMQLSESHVAALEEAILQEAKTQSMIGILVFTVLILLAAGVATYRQQKYECTWTRDGGRKIQTAHNSKFVRMYSVVVPEGLSTGSTFIATVNGQHMQIVVPKGATAGSTIQFPVGDYKNYMTRRTGIRQYAKARADAFQEWAES